MEENKIAELFKDIMLKKEIAPEAQIAKVNELARLYRLNDEVPFSYQELAELGQELGKLGFTKYMQKILKEANEVISGHVAIGTEKQKATPNTLEIEGKSKEKGQER
jgi:hypothetical protein